MVLEDEKKKMILKRFRQSAMKKLLAILVISSCFGMFVVLIMSFSDDLKPYAKMMAFGIFALLMVLFQLDDFLIAVCMLVECLILKKPEVKYDIVNAS